MNGYVTLRNGQGKPWVSVPILHEACGLAITPCVDSVNGNLPRRGRYFVVTHLKSGKKVAGGPCGTSRSKAMTALTLMGTLPINWYGPAAKVLREAKPYMEVIRSIREGAR